MRIGNVFSGCLGCAGNTGTVTPTENNGVASRQSSSHVLRGKLENLQVDEQLRSGFDPVKSLGRGGVASTWLFRDKSRNELVAIKLIPRPLPSFILKSIVREIKIQTELAYGHISIVDVYEVILLKSHVAIVMEYIGGGSLVQFLHERAVRATTTGLYMSEEEARFFFKQFVQVVGYCHANSVVHRDLKLDNTLLDTSTPPRVKLIDFGFARMTEGYADTHVGTPVYMAPELLNNKEKGYDGRAVDVWATGVLLCVMLLGAFPFDDQENSQPLKQDESEKILWSQMMSRNWSDRPQLVKGLAKLSEELRDLMDKIFVLDDKQRITIEQIMEHAWYKTPLASKYQQAWDEIQGEQSQLLFSRKSRQVDMAKVDARSKAIDKLVELASKKAGSAPGDDYMCIDLREAAVVDQVPQEST